MFAIIGRRKRWQKRGGETPHGAKLEENCNERGTEAYNEILSLQRAGAAKKYLIALGVDAGRTDYD